MHSMIHWARAQAYDPGMIPSIMPAYGIAAEERKGLGGYTSRGHAPQVTSRAGSRLIV